MTNQLSGMNDLTRKDARDLRRPVTYPGDGAGQQYTAPHWAAAREAEPNGDGVGGSAHSNRLLGALPAEELTRLFPHLEPVTLKAGTVLYKLDEEMRYAYFPETAVVSHLYILREGGMTESDMIGREGVVGLSAVFNVPPPSYLTEVALTGGATRARVDLLRQEFARGGAFQQMLVRYAAARISLLSRRAVCNGNHRVEERLCTWLLMMHDRAGEGAPMALTHERISRHLGTRRAGVTGAATALRERGIIDYTRGHIRVIDRGLLEAAACECYPSVRDCFRYVA